MTTRKAIVAATTSGTFVMVLLLNALTFNKAEVTLGGDAIIERMIRLHTKGAGRT